MTSTATATNNGNSAVNGNGAQPPLTSDDLEEVLLELNRFEKSPAQNIPNLLERYLEFVARTGSANFPWTKVKPLFRSKLENVIIDFSNVSPADEVPPVPNVDVFNFSAIRNKVFEQLDAFAGIPFTVQRLAELLTSPRRHYKRTDKFMRALEKNMLIVSTVEARANNNNDSESRNSSYLMNGDYMSNGNGINKDGDNSDSETSSSSSELASNTQTALQRDNVEDDLDAEMPSSPPLPASASNANSMLSGANGSLNAPLNEANTTAAVVTEPISDGLPKPPEENVEDEMVTDQEMITDEEKSPDTSGPSDAKRLRLDENTKERSEDMVEPSTNEAAQADHATKEDTEDQSKSVMEVVTNEDIESVPSSSSEPSASTAASSKPETEEAVAKEATPPPEIEKSDASSSTQPEQKTPEAAPTTEEPAKETTTTDKSGEPSDVISSTEENNENVEKNTEAEPTANPAENLATTKSQETSSSENNEASTSE